MKYNVVYSAEARRDLRDIYEYIAYKLLEPDIGSEQISRIMKAINSLDEMPMRYGLYNDDFWGKMGMRFIPVDNYLVFYLPDEASGIVNIIRIMYAGRDIKSQLNQNKIKY